MANENSIDVYHALMALEEKVTGVAPDPENVTTDVALALADIFRTDAPMAQETAIVNAIDTITANYGGGGGVDVGAPTYIVGGTNAPKIGDYTSDYSDVISGIAIGDAVIVLVTTLSAVPFVAAGATVTTRPDMDANPTSCAAYVVTVDDGQITAVEPWSGTLTPGTFDYGMGTLNVWSFDVPALEYDDDTETGKVLCIRLYK